MYTQVIIIIVNIRKYTYGRRTCAVYDIVIAIYLIMTMIIITIILHSYNIVICSGRLSHTQGHGPVAPKTKFVSQNQCTIHCALLVLYFYSYHYIRFFPFSFTFRQKKNNYFHTLVLLSINIEYYQLSCVYVRHIMYTRVYCM